MNLIQNSSIGIIKFLNINNLFNIDYFLHLIREAVNSHQDALKLSKDLYDWNNERIAKANANSDKHDLTEEDIGLVKEKIYAAVKKSSQKTSEVFLDQLFFLTIGAIQIQMQSKSDQAWQLLDHTIYTHLKPQKDKRILTSALLSLILMMSIGTMMMTTSSDSKVNRMKENSLMLTNYTSPDQVTITLLQRVHEKMKDGTCQLPQAAMLPPEQRKAFLLFVNKGVIEVQDVENLRLALGYVNCLYPQELMGSSITLANLK